MQELTETSYSRIQWIDTAKLVGIFFVVWAHMEGKVPIYLFAAFYMPLFFMLSGYVEKKRSFSETLRNSFFQLMVPYFALNSIAAIFRLFSFIVFHLMESGTIDLYKAAKKIAEYIIGIIIADTTEFSFFPCGPCWFLFSLFQMKLLFSFISTTVKKRFKTILVLLSVVMVFLAWLLCLKGIKIYFVVNETLMGFVFYVTGFLMKNFLSEIFNKKNKYDFLIIAVLLFAYFLFVFFSIKKSYGLPNLRGGVMPGQSIFSILHYYTGGLLGSWFLIFICKYISLSKLPEYLSKNTLSILAYHWIFLSNIKHMYEGLIGKKLYLDYIPSFIFALVILILCVIPTYISEKYFPFVIGKKKSRNNSE